MFYSNKVKVNSQSLGITPPLNRLRCFVFFPAMCLGGFVGGLEGYVREMFEEVWGTCLGGV